MKRLISFCMTALIISGVISLACFSASAGYSYQKYMDEFNSYYSEANDRLKRQAEEKATADTSVEAKSFSNDNGAFTVNSPLPDDEYKAGEQITLALTSAEVYSFRYVGGQQVTSPDTVKMTILKDGSVVKEYTVKISSKDLGVKFSDTYTPDAAGTYLVNIKYNGDNCGSYNFTVSDEPAKRMTVKAAAKSIKASALKKSKKTVKPLTIKDAAGEITVKKVKNGTTASIFKKITVNKRTGAITLKKGSYAKKTYKIKLRITDGDITVTKTVRIKVK